jgi:hypothetical protein
MKLTSRNPYAAHLRNKPPVVISNGRHRKVKRRERKAESEREAQRDISCQQEND